MTGRGLRLGAALLLASALLTQPLVTTPARAAVYPTAAVAADHPIASQVGADILAAGGNAADAAVAVALALGVLNPFASGIGGGGFALYHDAASGETVALDFRETAPERAHRDMYVVNGQVDRARFLHGGLAVAVPGEVAGLHALHERFGRLPWRDVVTPAVRLARDGFEVGELLPDRLARINPDEHRDLARLYQVDGRWVQAGETLRQPALARTLTAIAAEGPNGFYRGAVAQDLVATVRRTGGVLSMRDLRDYRVQWLEPLEGTVSGHRVVSFPPPSSGGLVLLQALGVLEGYALERLSPIAPYALHLIAETLAHAFADRAIWMSDPSFYSVPSERLLSGQRRQQIRDALNPARTLDPEDYGVIRPPRDDGGTSHLSVVDADGNAVALTTTVNTLFGARVVGMRSGVVLNNEMSDFSPQPGQPNVFGLLSSDANAIEAGKRPLSSMTPVLVFDADGALVGTLGGSGGPRIITATLQVLLHLLRGEVDTETAVALPRVHHQWFPFLVFVNAGFDDETIRGLESYGHEVQHVNWEAAVQAIWRREGGWDAASDPSKRGAPAGY